VVVDAHEVVLADVETPVDQYVRDLSACHLLEELAVRLRRRNNQRVYAARQHVLDRLRFRIRMFF
jgi:hypothetical protein